MPLDESFVVDYYKSRDLADLEASRVCPSRAAACSSGLLTWSAAALDRHELTHAYFSSLPPSNRLFEEGIAEALSSQVPANGSPAPWASLEEAFVTPTVYAGAASTLWVRFGGLALIDSDLKVEAAPFVRVRGCQGCDESAGSKCVELASGEPFVATEELVLEINASHALPQHRWFRLRAGASAQ